MKDNHLRRPWLYLLPALLSIGLLAACDDDDDVRAPLATPSNLAAATAATSLTFSWEAVPNAVEYYCVLSKGGSVAAEQAVEEASVTFTGLTPSTDYKLCVTAYAAIGSNDHVESATIELESRTADPVKLVLPDSSVAAPVVDGQSVTISWTAVDNASSYSYVLANATATVAEGNIDVPTVSFSNLVPGEYSLAVTACSDDPAFTDSEPTLVAFTIEAAKVTEWKGTLCINADWEEDFLEDGTADDTLARKLLMNADGSYTLVNAYDGIDIKFTIEEDDSGYGRMNITNSSKSGIYNYFYVDGTCTYVVYDGEYSYAYVSDDEVTIYWYAYSYITYEQTTEYFTYTKDEYVGMFYYQEDTTATPEYLWKKMVRMVDNGDGTYTFKSPYAAGYDLTISINDDASLSIENSYYTQGYRDYVHVSSDEENRDFCCYTASAAYGVGYVTESYVSVWWSRWDYREVADGLWGADYFYIGEWE